MAVPIRQWSYTFRTNLNFQAVDESQVINAARKRLELATLGDYTLERLMMDISGIHNLEESLALTLRLEIQIPISYSP